MYIKEFITPAMACSGVSIGSAVRKGNVLLCESDDVDVERILIEFDDEETAQLLNGRWRTMPPASLSTKTPPWTLLPRN